MTEWEESTAKGGIAAPASGQPWTGMPASGGPGSGRGRRAGLVIALVIVLVALGAGGYLFVRSRQHKRAGGNQVAAVRRAYLTWWNARVQEYLTLNPAPVKPYMTAAGYEQEKMLFDLTNQGPFQLVATHNLQAVVYSDRVDASIDDVWLSTSSPLDPKTHQPVGSKSDIYAEDSASLRKVSGRWLVDDVVRIGASQTVPGQQLSYAAVDHGVSPPQPVLGQIEAAYRHYSQVRDAAYLNLSDQSLPQVETGGALSDDIKIITQQRAANQPIRYADEDNYRVALQDSSTAWIYDTVGDDTAGINPKTKAPVGPVTFAVDRATYELTKGPDGWLVEYFGVISQS